MNNIDKAWEEIRSMDLSMVKSLSCIGNTDFAKLMFDAGYSASAKEKDAQIKKLTELVIIAKPYIERMDQNDFERSDKTSNWIRSSSKILKELEEL